MSIITKSKDLAAACEDLCQAEFVTVDTEFLRDKTYYPKLCLVQICAPGCDPIAIDPLAEGMDMEPLRRLLCGGEVLKVFHAGRQDLEIFFNIFECVPSPIFDTQVAAMVCGYGESAGYQKLVQDICGHMLDKTHQFTDWEYRPLSKKQITYALDDVTYLRDIYLYLSGQLKQRGRENWLAEEMAILTNPQTYQSVPENAWEKLKLKNTKPKTLVTAQALAAWREREAMKKNIPKSWILRDETLVDLAQRGAKTPADLERIRNFPSNRKDGVLVQSVLEILQETRKGNCKSCQRKTAKCYVDAENTATFEMLRMLLKIRAAEEQVAAKIIASQDDLKILANEENPDIKPLKGWRGEVFGKDALALKSGKIGLSLKDGDIIISDI